MSARTSLSWELTDGKIQPWHRDRLAVVYVRQSTRQQVLDHSESTKLQYALAERASSLGWPATGVLVIDEDLGRTAAVADTRPGFQRLVTEVTMENVGVVLGIEMSRLARTGRDWHQLLELCALTGTLLGDLDGVYDPSYYNDRLLLGLKGTMSEAELYLIKQRMQSGRLAKARRGELAIPLPIGYLRLSNGDAALDPDEQAQDIVRLIFAMFDQIGTLHGVLAWLVAQGLQIPVRSRGGLNKGDLMWRPPNRETLQNMLHNPAYAGIYAYGRRQIDPRRKVAGRVGTGKVVQDRQDWLVMLPGRLPAYISSDQYEANLARLHANRNVADSAGTVKPGSSLLAGIVVCGHCKHRMRVSYHHRAGDRQGHSYVCAYNKINYGREACQHLIGVTLDEYVAGQLLTALAPAALEVSLQAAEQIEAERAALQHLWQQRLERADYETDRTRRQYQLAEPENRLVVRQLERDWEQAMASRAQLGRDFDRFAATTPATLTAAQCDAIRALAQDIPWLWHAPTTTVSDRKQLLRAVVERVQVTVLDNTEQVDITITWAGGHQTHGRIIRPVGTLEQLSYYPRMTALITELTGQGITAQEIAQRLHAEGMRPPKRFSAFTANSVKDMMRRLDITQPTARTRPAADLHPHEWLLPDLSRALNMPMISLYNWIWRDWVTARREQTSPYRWIIQADDTELDRLRELRTRAPGYYQRQRYLKGQTSEGDQP